MRVTRLEIFGFKSFVERFVLNFDENKLGIVGPNGCGKSNIVDALRWVLGETYAKHLRGTVLDDLIFNGSDNRRPLGMAEVSITIRPHENWQELALEPISLEEPIAPLNDAVLEDDDEKSDNSEENEVSAEEAARAKAEDEEVRAALNPLPAILAEVPGLLGASEIQFTRRLYRSGESEYFINRVPCRLRDMTDIYRLIGLGARGLSIVQQGEIGELISKKPVERRELLEEAAGISGFRTRMEAAQRKLERTAENMARLNDIINEVDKQVRVLSRQARRAKDRSDLRAELRRYDEELFAAKSAKIRLQQKHHEAIQDSLEAEIERVRSELALSEANQTALQAELESFEVQLSDRRRERDVVQQVLDANRARIAELRLETALTVERIGALKKTVERNDGKKVSLLQEGEEHRARSRELREQVVEKTGLRSAAERTLTEIQERAQAKSTSGELSLPLGAGAFGNERLGELQQEISRLQVELDRMPEVESQIKSGEQDVSAREGELRRSEQKAQHNRVQLASLQTEVGSLKRQLEAFAEHVVKAAQSESENYAGENRVFLAGLRVGEEFQTAVSAVLGERGQYLLTSSAFELAASFAKKAERGGKKIGVIDQHYSDSPAALASLSAEELNAAPSAQLLLTLIDVEAAFQPAARTFFGDVVFVNTLDEALALNAANRAAGRAQRSLVTRAGEMVFPWGWYTTEGKGLAFSFTQRIAEQEAAAGEISVALQIAEEECATAEAALAEARRALTTRREQRERLFEQQRKIVSLRREEQEIERKVRDALLAEERKLREALAQEERLAQQQLRQIMSELSGLEREAEFGEKKSSQIEAELSALDDQRTAQLSEIEELHAKQAELEQMLQSGDLNGGVDLNELQEKGKQLEESIRALDQERNPVRLKLAEESETVAQVRRELGQFQEQLNKTELEIEKCGLEGKMLLEDVLRVYSDMEAPGDEQIEALLSRAGSGLDEIINEAQEESVRIRKRIEREGEVDPQSIELFEQEDARLQGMRAQLADLESAAEILGRTIRQLKEVSRTRFIETFEAVSSKFSELIPRLFGGGAGHLQLVNPDDPLESGVEIFVRPPGKKISNMELLSGGEKALVAVSVLISMFLHRPSPICVLDEVDAPLDEANLERYLGLVSEIAHSTQFLIITHNKRTMAEADRLIGITMQEKGVTTALSVSLDDSEDEIDRLIANA